MNDFLAQLPLFFTSFALIKLAILLLLGLYGIFAFVIVNQVNTMNGIIRASIGAALMTFLSLLHLAFVVVLFIFALVVL